MEKTMQVLYVPAKGRMKSIEIENSLDTLQMLVGGNIEPVFDPNGFIIIVNEDGLLIGLERNHYMPQYVGNVIICKEDKSGEEFAGLTVREIDRVKNLIADGYFYDSTMK